MKIEVGKSYCYIANRGLRPHPNEIIEDGTIVMVTEILPGGVMLAGYDYPHKVERLQEMEVAIKNRLEEFEVPYCATKPHDPEVLEKLYEKAFEEALASGITREELIEWLSKSV